MNMKSPKSHKFIAIISCLLADILTGYIMYSTFLDFEYFRRIMKNIPDVPGFPTPNFPLSFLKEQHHILTNQLFFMIILLVIFHIIIFMLFFVNKKSAHKYLRFYTVTAMVSFFYMSMTTIKDDFSLAAQYLFIGAFYLIAFYFLKSGTRKLVSGSSQPGN
jgi:hypothetical protein